MVFVSNAVTELFESFMSFRSTVSMSFTFLYFDFQKSRSKKKKYVYIYAMLFSVSFINTLMNNTQKWSDILQKSYSICCNIFQLCLIVLGHY